jgi:hypothetical protein
MSTVMHIPSRHAFATTHFHAKGRRLGTYTATDHGGQQQGWVNRMLVQRATASGMASGIC